jgi:3-oxoacyl-[acyl-carrier protein] reductase
MTPIELPSSSLSGFHALVCGASSGIGRAIALTFAARGARVTVMARRGALLDELVEQIAAAGLPPARALVADHARREELARQVDTLLADGPVHVLVNNSGGPPSGPLLQATEDQFEDALGRHLLASHLLVLRVLPGMKEAGYGRILNVISTSVREPIARLGVSNTTRGAVASWAKTLSDELPPGITINNLLPGFTDTERLTELAEVLALRGSLSVDQVQQGWLGTIPEGRLGDPLETAAVAALLASPAGGYVRGQSIAVDGGRLRSI